MPGAVNTAGCLPTDLVWVWGSNISGQCGNNASGASYSQPFQVMVGDGSYTHVVCGANNTLILKADTGEAWACGQNVDGRLGDNTTTDKSSPVAVVGNHSFIAIASGANTSFGLKANGEVWAWGANNQGQVGNNTSLNSYSSPVAVVGNHSFIQIKSATTTAIALKINGSAWCWGRNNAGSVGNNTSGNSYSSPVAVVGNHSFVAVAGGANACAGLKNTGAVWMWGNATRGRLGDNTTTDKSSPVAVVGSHSFKAISLGQSTSYGLKADGSVWAWGENLLGQVGDNTITNRSSPVAVIGAHSFNLIAAGTDHCVAMKADGTFWAWGDNTNGQLGDGTVTGRSSPVAVVATSATGWRNIMDTRLHRMFVNVGQTAFKPIAYAYVNTGQTKWDRVVDINVDVASAWKKAT